MLASPIASDIDFLPIALCKSKCTCTSHPIIQFVSCDHLSPSLREFTLFVSTACVRKLVSKALSVPCYSQAMVDNMTALHDNGTWEMVPFPFKNSIVGCR